MLNRPLQSFLTQFKTGQHCGIIAMAPLFNTAVRKDLVDQAVRYERSWREVGTESTKRLSQVRGSGSKAFPQKGRGKARVGSIRAPHIKGGYNAHGARPHLKTIDIQRKVYNQAIVSALASKFQNDQILVVDSLETDISTKTEFVSHLKSLGMYRKVYFMYGGLMPNTNFLRLTNEFTKKLAVAGDGKESPLLMTRADHVNVCALLDHELIVMDKQGLEEIEQKYQIPF